MSPELNELHKLNKHNEPNKLLFYAKLEFTYMEEG
jgi:hypothetical protein